MVQPRQHAVSLAQGHAKCDNFTYDAMVHGLVNQEPTIWILNYLSMLMMQLCIA